MTSQYMEIKFSGNEISPEKVTAEELIQIIRAFDSMIFYAAKSNNPSLARKDIKLSISNIASGSLKIEFCSFVVSAAVAFQLVSGAIDSNAMFKVPERARESLLAISDFSKRYSCNANFTLNHQEKPLAVLTPETKILISQGLRCQTRIYGVIQKIGGSSPIVKIKTFNGDLLQGRCSKKVAKILGAHIYDKVALIADVTCNEHDGRLTNINFLGLCNDYNPEPIDEAFAGLRSEFSDFFKDIDPEKYVEELRNK